MEGNPDLDEDDDDLEDLEGNQHKLGLTTVTKYSFKSYVPWSEMT